MGGSDRRAALRALAGAGAIALAGRAFAGGPDPVMRAILDAEARLGARMGVMIRETGGGRGWTHRADERFPMCSVFKALAGAAVLARVDTGEDSLARHIAYGRADLVPYSPVTEAHAGEGMSLGALCEAAITVSDNSAGNLVLATLGGPEGLTRWLRAIGDVVTRLDRWETALNEAVPGDPRDTTTPAALCATLEAVALGPVLSPASRAGLVAWLAGNTVGDAKVRAGLPAGWRVGDKTGAGGQGTNNDAGLIWPPGRPPIVFAILTTQTTAPVDAKNAAMADIARALAGTS
jgi:beta-lactamase class A